VTGSGRPNAYARYDLGQAVAHFSVQAQANGLSVHQMGGFDIEALTVSLGVNEPDEIVVAFSVGVAGDADALPEALREREDAPRERKPLSDVIR
jgi:hypothetical protein